MLTEGKHILREIIRDVETVKSRNRLWLKYITKKNWERQTYLTFVDKQEAHGQMFISQLRGSTSKHSY